MPAAKKRPARKVTHRAPRSTAPGMRPFIALDGNGRLHGRLDDPIMAPTHEAHGRILFDRQGHFNAFSIDLTAEAPLGPRWVGHHAVPKHAADERDFGYTGIPGGSIVYPADPPAAGSVFAPTEPVSVPERELTEEEIAELERIELEQTEKSRLDPLYNARRKASHLRRAVANLEADAQNRVRESPIHTELAAAIVALNVAERELLAFEHAMLEASTASSTPDANQSPMELALAADREAGLRAIEERAPSVEVDSTADEVDESHLLEPAPSTEPTFPIPQSSSVSARIRAAREARRDHDV